MRIRAVPPVNASLWRGRLSASMHPLAQHFLSSFAEDADLAQIDIDVAGAHALSLARGGLFTRGELRRLPRASAAALGGDADRVLAARARGNRSPLGAAAVAGTSVPVHRAWTARLLGFDGVWPNALDATSARDHLLELLAALAILQSDLSRLA